jgi:hypothetical protein
VVKGFIEVPFENIKPTSTKATGSPSMRASDMRRSSFEARPIDAQFSIVTSRNASIVEWIFLEKKTNKIEKSGMI